ncbi:MAG: hypothetical protein LBH43_11545 [Treponema sp.]|jgi:hypothetical protein|nr:hypothetical protein [Treponema sp.]
MVYLARKNGAVVHHTDKAAMARLDGVEPEKQVTDAEFEEAGGLVRIINNKIVLGKTAAEKTEDERQAKIADYEAQLAAIDREAGSGRATRDLAIIMAEKSGETTGEAYKKLKAFESRAKPIREKLEPLQKA